MHVGGALYSLQAQTPALRSAPDGLAVAQQQACAQASARACPPTHLMSRRCFTTSAATLQWYTYEKSSPRRLHSSSGAATSAVAVTSKARYADRAEPPLAGCDTQMSSSDTCGCGAVRIRRGQPIRGVVRFWVQT